MTGAVFGCQLLKCPQTAASLCPLGRSKLWGRMLDGMSEKSSSRLRTPTTESISCNSSGVWGMYGILAPCRRTRCTACATAAAVKGTPAGTRRCTTLLQPVRMKKFQAVTHLVQKFASAQAAQNHTWVTWLNCATHVKRHAVDFRFRQGRRFFYAGSVLLGTRPK